MTEFSKREMRVGRVLSDDPKQITLEIMKEDDPPYTLDPEGGDKFFTVLFIHQPPGATEPKVWLPWEQESEGEGT
jgi:hypothetical protein